MSDVLDRTKLLNMKRGKGARDNDALIFEYAFYHYIHGAPPVLTMNIEVSLEDYRETDAVRAAQHYFHGLCQYLADGTAEWELSKDDIAAMRLSPTPQSSNTGETA